MQVLVFMTFSLSFKINIVPFLAFLTIVYENKKFSSFHLIKKKKEFITQAFILRHMLIVFFFCWVVESINKFLSFDLTGKRMLNLLSAVSS